MNSKDFRALKDGTIIELVSGLTSEILDTVKQGGITKISEVKTEVELMVKELFGETKRSALVNQVMAEIDDKLIVSIKI